jgi:multiple sugar transport system permease protein
MAPSQKDRVAWLLLVPMIAIMAVVTGFPLLNTVWLAFTDASLTGQGYDWNWSGLENFSYILDDADFRAAVGHTSYFTVVSVSIEVVLGVLIALLLDQEFFGRTAVRALLILPWALPTIVNAVMWRLIYNPEFGSLNALLTQLGLLDSYRSWLGDPASAMNAVIVADIWKNYPLIALIVLAGLQTVPKDLHEAAIMDGAGAWTRFWNITFPGILGPLSVALVLRAIEAFKVFDIIYVMTRGGPADATKTASFFVYQESFTYLRAGSGAAYALTVTAMSGAMIALYIAMLRRRGRSA